jgi:hypothetical protein
MEEIGRDAFEKICDAWGLSDAERSGLLQKTSEGDQLICISYVMGIYKALHILLPGPNANSWVCRPNRHFGDRPALSVMLDDPHGLKKVRQYLDGQLV